MTKQASRGDLGVSNGRLMNAPRRARNVLARNIPQHCAVRSCQRGTAMATKASASRFIVASARSLAWAKVSPLFMGSQTST